MLVLTRKLHQKVHIGEDITITVTRIDGDRVRIGIDAPPDVFVRREELITQWDPPTGVDEFRPSGERCHGSEPSCVERSVQDAWSRESSRRK